MSLNKEFKLQQYTTIEELECVHWDNQITIDDLKDDKIDCYGTIDQNGNESVMSWQDMKKSCEQMGYWGFADSRDNTIHFWLKEDYKISFEELLFFFGHEMGHLMKGGIKPSEEDYSENSEEHWKEEERADEYGYVAKMAYKFTNEILNKNESE